MRHHSPSANFLIRAAEFEPAYLRLHRDGELLRRAQQAVASMVECRACPRECGVNRLEDREGKCNVGRWAQVSSWFAHHGEEDCLRGWHGSGTIFFSMCNLRCVFCQNYDISQMERGEATRSERLAEMMLALQGQGCHNINFVTPEHVVPQLLEALPMAIEAGLRLPLVYNTSAYDGMDSLRLLDGVVDIYMPDFKVWDPQEAKLYLGRVDYPAAARCALTEMHRQVGVLKLDERGLARRGLLVRHLVMPGGLAGTRQIMEFLAHELSPHTYVNVMEQYRPAGRVTARDFPELDRPTTAQEHRAALEAARAAGLYRFDQRRHPAGEA